MACKSLHAGHLDNAAYRNILHILHADNTTTLDAQITMPSDCDSSQITSILSIEDKIF